ncbi:MAG TPA: aminotransferase class V-fold PLP-dependent enzyme [Roseiflexaceae bacterium]|nr:aminotransferase class V-fold PLP-dependent enzyme [Roseiflexaceae bacterium]
MQLPFLKDQFLLRPEISFLNHGSFGACPRPVFEEHQRWQRELEEQPVEFLGRRIGGLLRGARARLAAYVGAEPSSLLLVPNATHGVNIVARSLDLRPGDEVLATDHEYGASDRTWRFVCARRGARYINQPIAPPLDTPEHMVEQLWAGVTPRTRVIFLSHITSPTGLVFPLAQICARARAEGILTVVDGAHAPGQIDLDMAALGVDFYTGNCHKWLCNQRASGFLYAHPKARALLAPLIVSWGWEPEEEYEDGFQYMFEWTGTYNPAPYLTIPTAIDFQAANRWPEARAACHALLGEASREVAALTGLAPLSPETGGWWWQMRALPLPPCDHAALKARLLEERGIEVPIRPWNGVPLLRISVQCYNGPDDIDRLLDGLRAFL